MRSLLQSHGLVDAWWMPGRGLHPHDHDFTFYSSPHDNFCRIDHVFIPLCLISNIHKITITSSAWSDHDPIVFLLTFSGLSHPTFQWRQNDSLLTSQDAQDPRNPHTPPNFLWGKLGLCFIALLSMGGPQGHHARPLYTNSVLPKTP